MYAHIYRWNSRSDRLQEQKYRILWQRLYRLSSNCLQSEDSLNRIYKSIAGYIDENIACQGASEAIRRRATLDTADEAKAE